MPKYKLLEHTADLRLLIYGKNLEDIFNNSAKALLDIALSKKKALTLKSSNKLIILKDKSKEDLLISWLNELLFLLYSRNTIAKDIKLKITHNNNLYILKAKVKTQEIALSSKNIKTEIKAATYYNTQITKYKNGYKTEVVLDV